MKGHPSDPLAAHFAVHTRHLIDNQNPSCGCVSCRISQALKELYLRRGLFEEFPRLGELLDLILSLPPGAPSRDRAVNDLAVVLSRMGLALAPLPRVGASGVGLAQGYRRMAERFLTPARGNRRGG